MRMDMSRLKGPDGFTLVELGVSMIVIGLLIGLVVKGGVLMDTARVSSTVAQVNGVKAAVTSFQALYDRYPGDATAIDLAALPCVAPCAAGDGNGVIGVDLAWNASAPGPAPADETAQFWKHLVLAEFLTSVSLVDPLAAYAYGMTHPTSRFGGGYDVFYDAALTPQALAAGVQGHFIRLSLGALSGAPLDGGTPWLHPVSGQLARSIDLKADDGLPFSGSVLSAGGGCAAPAAGAAPAAPAFAVTSPYATTDQKTCTMYFKFGGRRR